MGRSRFVMRFWVLGWGLTTALFWSLLMAYTEGWYQLPIFLAFGLIGFPPGGLVIGRMMWAMNERYAAKTSLP